MHQPFLYMDGRHRILAQRVPTKRKKNQKYLNVGTSYLLQNLM